MLPPAGYASAGQLPAGCGPARGRPVPHPARLLLTLAGCCDSTVTQHAGGNELPCAVALHPCSRQELPIVAYRCRDGGPHHSPTTPLLLASPPPGCTRGRGDVEQLDLFFLKLICLHRPGEPLGLQCMAWHGRAGQGRAGLGYTPLGGGVRSTTAATGAAVPSRQNLCLCVLPACPLVSTHLPAALLAPPDAAAGALERPARAQALHPGLAGGPCLFGL